MRRADAVGAGVATADDDDVLALRRDLALDVLPERDAVGRREEVHRLHHAVELAARHGQVARHGGPDRDDDGVEPLAQVGAGEVAPHLDTPVRKRVPSDFIWAIRRSRTAFSILNSGMP